MALPTRYRVLHSLCWLVEPLAHRTARRPGMERSTLGGRDARPLGKVSRYVRIVLGRFFIGELRARAGRGKIRPGCSVYASGALSAFHRTGRESLSAPGRDPRAARDRERASQSPPELSRRCNRYRQDGRRGARLQANSNERVPSLASSSSRIGGKFSSRAFRPFVRS